jgi:hypothetical protein
VLGSIWPWAKTPAGKDALLPSRSWEVGNRDELHPACSANWGIGFPHCPEIGGSAEGGSGRGPPDGWMSFGNANAIVIPETPSMLMELPSFLTIRPALDSFRRYRRSVSTPHPSVPAMPARLLIAATPVLEAALE